MRSIESAHPAFWWIWAVLISTALIYQNTLSTSLAILGSIFLIATIIGIPKHRRAIFAFTIRLALFALVIRLLFAILIGVPLPGRTLFSLPEISLPDFLVGIRVGGPVTSERLYFAFTQGVMFAALITIFGLANSLSTPAQLIKSFPNRLYGLGVAVTLATTITPSIAKAVSRVRQAQYLRGQASQGVSSWRRIGSPVLEDALARSIDLAAAMEARGYGRSKSPTKYRRQSWRTADLIALLGAAYFALLFPALEIGQIFKLVILIFLITLPAVLR